MNPFTYTRAGDASEAVQLGVGAGTKYLGGGTNLVDLMRETLERPVSLVDVTQLSDGRRAVEWSGGAEYGGCGTSRGADAVSGAGAGDPGGRFGADSQYGDGGREHSAADALHVLL
jgi:hypothetical protein